MKKQARRHETFDVMVLGAGIVGVSTAIHLHRRGLDVALVDQIHPAAEASFGNAGLVQRNGFAPYAVPTRPQKLLSVLLKQSCDISYNLATLVRLAPWLRRYQACSTGRAVERYSRTIAPLKHLAIQEHMDLAEASIAERFYRRGGWLDLHRSERSFKGGETERQFARVHGVSYDELSSFEIGKLEPALQSSGLRAIHWKESWSVSNPGAVVEAFWRGYIRENGACFRGDARKLENQRGGWTLECERNSLFARNVVIALGAWSMEVLKDLGEIYPLAVKRGYHMHFRPKTGVSLSRPVVDIDNGFVLSPMDKGIRLTTGVELAERDAPADPNIMRLCMRRAGEIFPLGSPLEEKPWMGSRPCLPDSLPVVGASPKNRGLWLNFGHAHEGFTLGPVTGRLLADLIVGKTPVADMTGISPMRFAV